MGALLPLRHQAFGDDVLVIRLSQRVQKEARRLHAFVSEFPKSRLVYDAIGTRFISKIRTVVFVDVLCVVIDLHDGTECEPWGSVGAVVGISRGISVF